ncbi:hypothetical protein [Sphingomonas sp. S2-65]|uniref:hypothetical protein n=1 Tax=Sphingomonas sp. S2-65 TaxID=2903960 RepID=UPI001F237874|nr:hypothetical protein [Sphingomonas sp. S2-65]UYY58536.1 hypothetical protein LZ586_18125 [Sphingomonas sp. S2-65]
MLAPLPYKTAPQITPEMNSFVQREAIGRKCPMPQGGSMTVDVAVLVDQAGGIRTTVPRAIGCATVEQYAAALVAGFARNNLLPRTGLQEQWYRTTLTFTWPT